MKLFLMVSVTLLSGIMIGFYLSSSYTGHVIEIAGNGINFDEIPHLSLNDYSKVNVKVDYETIFLTNNCRLIAMATNPVQTHSIQRGLQDVFDFRPTSHDIIMHILETYDIDVLMVKINDFRNDTYFAKLILKHGDKILNLDSRPSDAIAIAARLGTDIYVKNDILTNQGVDFC